MDPSVARPNNTSKWVAIGGVAVVFVVIMLAAASRNSSGRAASGSSAESQTPPPPTFGAEQNDSEGYNKIAWGTSLSDFDKVQRAASATLVHDQLPFVSNSEFAPSSYQSEPNGRFVSEESKMVAKLFGVPDAKRSIAGVDLSDTNWVLVPKKFQSVKKDDVEYVFYDGKFSMAFSQLNARSYDAVKAELASKYAEMGTVSDSWVLQQLEENPDKMGLQATIYKRGQTNTRVFLIKEVEHMSIGMKSTSVYLLYVPNAYYEAIRAEIARNESSAAAESQANEIRTQQPDLQKVQ